MVSSWLFPIFFVLFPKPDNVRVKRASGPTIYFCFTVRENTLSISQKKSVLNICYFQVRLGKPLPLPSKTGVKQIEHKVTRTQKLVFSV